MVKNLITVPPSSLHSTKRRGPWITGVLTMIDGGGRMFGLIRLPFEINIVNPDGCDAGGLSDLTAMASSAHELQASALFQCAAVGRREWDSDQVATWASSGAHGYQAFGSKVDGGVLHSHQCRTGSNTSANYTVPFSIPPVPACRESFPEIIGNMPGRASTNTLANAIIRFRSGAILVSTNW